MFNLSSLNDENDCNVVSRNSLNIHDANDMQNYKLGDENFVMCTTYCNDHDWGDDASYDLENLFKPHDEYVIDNKICNTIKSGFGRASTLGNNDPTTLENYQSYDSFYKSGFGEVTTFVDDNPTNLKDYKFFMHVDHEEKILYDCYIV